MPRDLTKSRYNGLYARTVDLVGDYAGDELFLVDGDSLLLHVFSDEKLDFFPGFQLLHATYMVEVFLHALLRRKCRFHVVFFADNARLCIPPSAPSTLNSRYLLAREAIIQHLSHNLNHVNPRVKIKVFDGYELETFRAYLASSGAYFFMCHDGALGECIHREQAQNDSSDSHTSSEAPDEPDGDDVGIDDSEWALPTNEVPSKLGFRRMIHWLICHGYNVALITTLVCRDTKACVLS